MGIPVVGHVVAAGFPLLFSDVDSKLAAAGIPEADGDATPTATAVVSAPSDWTFATDTCWYAAELVDGLPSDGPVPGKGRHQWLLKQNVRLACAHRCGCLSKDDYEQARKLLDDRFTEIVATTPPRRAVGRYELVGAATFGAQKAATKTEDEARAELSGHEHDDWMMTVTNSSKTTAGTTSQAAGNGPPLLLLDTLAVNGKWLDGQQFNDLEFAVEGVIPEGLGLLVAPPKKGKSFLVADVGLAVAAGRSALGSIPVTKRPVLYLALEDGHRRLQDRFRRITNGGAIPAGIQVITKATPAEAIQVIAEFIGRHALAKPLVILDTLGKVKPPKRRNEDAYQADYALGTQLKNLADMVPGSTLLVVDHTRKAEALDFVDSVSGTQGIAGSVDFVLVLDRKRLSNEAVLSVTGRDVIEAEYALKAEDGILWRLEGADLTAAADTVEKRRLQDKVGDRLMEVFRFVDKSKDAVTATDVANALKDMDGDQVGRYLRRLKAAGHIIRLSRGRYVPAAPVQ